MDITSKQYAVLLYAQRVVDSLRTLAGAQVKTRDDIAAVAHAARIGADALDAIAHGWGAETEGSGMRNYVEQVMVTFGADGEPRAVVTP